MAKFFILIVLVLVELIAYGQSNTMCYHSIEPITNRSILNDSVFDKIVRGGWNKVTQDSTLLLGLDAFDIRKCNSGNCVDVGGGSIQLDTSNYYLHGIGFKINLSDTKGMTPITFGAVFTSTITSNIFKWEIKSWEWPTSSRIIYGYLDKKNYLYIAFGDFNKKNDPEKLAKLHWVKYYRPGISVYKD